MAQYFPYLLPQASSFAGQIDFLFWLITAVCVAFFVGVLAFLTFFVVRYREGTKVNRVLPHHEGIALELVWTLIPLFIAIALFFVSASVYFQTQRAPRNCTEIFVVGKQWMWKIQHDNGRWEMNELHIPVDHPVKLTMISEDVIHDFGLPDFRLNMDVIPGRYTQMWFNPVRVGDYHLFCAQFCGTNHAIMGGFVHVMEPDAYEKWMDTGYSEASFESKGETLFRVNGCTGCHGPSASVRAPSLTGIYMKPQAIQVADGIPWNPNIPATTMIADNTFIHDCIVLPARNVVAGYRPIMPSYRGRLSEADIMALVDYIKSLRSSNGTSNGLSTGYEETAGQTTGGNAIGLSNDGSARTGRIYGGNPTGDMADENDRDAIFRQPLTNGTTGDAASGKLYGVSPNGDMSNERDRDNIFHGGGNASNTALLDEAAGGVNGRNYSGRGGLSVYSTNNYNQSNVPVYSGGLHPVAGSGSDNPTGLVPVGESKG